MYIPYIALMGQAMVEKGINKEELYPKWVIIS